jgi:replicative DNA helicase
MSLLNHQRSVYSVLGSICKDVSLLRNPDIVINEEDFETPFHKAVHIAIWNIAFSDVSIGEITPVDIDNYLSGYPKLYQVWSQHDGIEYMTKSVQNSNVDTFKHNYDLLKKFSLLRDYDRNGIDVSDIFNKNETDLVKQQENMTRLNNMSQTQIIEHFSLKLLNLRDKWSLSQNSLNFKAGDGIEDLLERLLIEPDYGYPFMNGYYNTVFRGMRLKKFMLRSAGTGTGKTRLAIADACTISCSHIFDYATMQYVSNGPSYPSLFISTELEKDELQTVMLAYVSGVNEEVIKKGRYSPEIHERLKIGLEIIKNSPIHAVYVDDFSISDIEAIIEQHILTDNVKYVFFDYIQMTPKLSRTMAQAFGSQLREDQILVQFSAALKILANKYEVYISSSTQLNRNSKDTEQRDTNSLRGGSATADKVDHGVLIFRASGKDHDKLKYILEGRGFSHKPNYSHWVYKNRGGAVSVAILWTLMDLGTMREECLFATDIDYNLLNIEDLHYMFEEEEEIVETTPEYTPPTQTEIPQDFIM